MKLHNEVNKTDMTASDKRLILILYSNSTFCSVYKLKIAKAEEMPPVPSKFVVRENPAT